jgi:predicted permease
MLRRFFRQVRVMFDRRFSRDLDEELRFHADMLEAHADDAADAARRRLPSPLRTREESRDAWGVGWWDRLAQDVRYALRLMVRRPGFSATAIGVLALALGASITLFSVVYAVLMRSLPFPDSDRLVLVTEGLPKIPGLEMMGVSPPDIGAFGEAQRSFGAIAAYHSERYEVSGAGEAERVDAARAAFNLFATLGVQPMLGRAFTIDEDRGAATVAIISHGLWQRKFQGDLQVLGKTIHLERKPYTIVGVLPERFEFPLRGIGFNDHPADVFVPLSLTKDELQGYGMRFKFFMVGRLNPGVDFAAARAEGEGLARTLIDRYPADFRQGGNFSLAFPMFPLHEAVVGKVQTMLWVLLAAVLLVLLVGCADLGGLLLTRAAARAGELKVRAALGAGRGRLVRQLVTESLVIAAIGGACGLALAWWLTTLISVTFAETLPRAHEIALDRNIVFASIGLSVLAALACGLAPAIWITDSRSLAIATRQSSGSTGERRLLQTLVIVQVTLALVLAIGAGLLARSLTHLLAIDPGYRSERVVSVTVALPLGGYSKPAEIRGFFQRTQQALDELPGATSTALSAVLPMSFFDQRSFTAEHHAPGVSEPAVVMSPVAGAYFETLGIPLREGRFFARSEQPRFAIVNDTLARLLWPGKSAVGERLKWGSGPTNNNPWMTVVGVVGDVKQRGLTTPVLPEIYVPSTQSSDASLVDPTWEGNRTMALLVRSHANVDPTVMLGMLRQRIQKLDPSLAITNARLLDTVVGEAVAPQRFNAWLLSAFAIASVALAALGLYGLLASFVVSRTREIGVRIALGAQRPDVLRLIVSQGVRLVMIGLVLGLAGAAFATRFMQTLLFGVQPIDPLTFAAVSVVLLVVGLLAALVPAWRAVTLDPVRALRSE